MIYKVLLALNVGLANALPMGNVHSAGGNSLSPSDANQVRVSAEPRAAWAACPS